MSGTFDVYVANLPPSYNESEIREVFDVAGDIQGVKILPNKNGGQGNVAFVKFISESDAHCCAQYMHNHVLDDGRTLTVRYRAKSQAPNGVVTSSNSFQVNEKPGLTNGNILSKIEEMVKLFVSHVETPIEFWAQSCSDASAATLEEITQKMESLCPTQPKVIGQLSTEKIYGCKFSEDELWYRCVVEKSLAKNEVHVRYIDYGNAEVADRFGLVTLPSDVSKIPALCECYRVEGLELVTTDIQSETFLNGLEVLSDLINEEKIDVKIRKKEKDVTFVKIYQDSEGALLDIPTKLISTGSIKVKMAGQASSFATAVKTPKTPPKTTFNHVTPIDYSSSLETLKVSKPTTVVAEKVETFGTKEVIVPEKSPTVTVVEKGQRISSEEAPQTSSATLEMYKEKVENSLNLIEQLKKQLAEKTNQLDACLEKPPTPVHVPDDKPAIVVPQADVAPVPPKKTATPPGFKPIKDTKDDEELVIKERAVKVNYSNVGGYKEEMKQLREMVELPLHHAKLFEDVGIKPPRGVLLTGSHGTGKTLIARAVANEMGVFFKEIFGPSIVSGSVEDSKKKLTEVFIEVLKKSPAILLVDRLDVIAPAKDSSVNKKAASQLLTLLNCLTTGVITIATANRVNDIDPMVRQFGVFDREINLGKPDHNSRMDILRILTKNMNLAKDVCINTVAEKTDGYVGSDLSTVCKLAGIHGIHTKIAGCQGNIQEGKKSISKEVLNSLKKVVLKMDNFKHALSVTNPSICEPSAEVPSTSWDDIGGMENVKTELQQLINYPSDCEKKAARLCTSPSKGILLYGAHGCGKRLFAKAIATQCKCSFVSLNAPELCTMGVRKSKPSVRDIFRKARTSAPCIIFIDEIDLIMKGCDSSAGGSTSLINEILTEIDDMDEEGKVYVIGSANRPANVHPAFRRSGRLGQMIHIPLPDETSRNSILERKLGDTVKSEEINSNYLSELAKHTEGFSGADFENIVSRACQLAADDGENDVPAKLSHRHFEGAIKAFCPSVSDTDIEECKKFAQEQNTNNLTNKNEKEIIEYLKKTLDTKEQGGDPEIKQLNNDVKHGGKRPPPKNNYVVLLGLFTIACFIYLLVLYIYTSMKYQ